MEQEEVRLAVKMSGKSLLRVYLIFFMNDRIIVSNSNGGALGAVAVGSLFGPVGMVAGFAAAEVSRRKRLKKLSAQGDNDMQSLEKKATVLYYKDIEKVGFTKFGAGFSFHVTSVQKKYSWKFLGVHAPGLTKDQIEKLNQTKPVDLIKNAIPAHLIQS